jgi:uncharacterized protein YbjT (DUF2867 family)
VKVLVVGATGSLGLKTVRELRALDATVRVTHRASSKHETLAQLHALGAELAVADLSDPASLATACAGIDVIVSTVQGLRDVIVDGQTNLLRAAEQAGVSRMIPSDYSLDFFKTTPGGNRNLDLRREFDGILDASRVRGTSILNGAFMDLIAHGRIGPDAAGVFKVFGDPDQPYDFTHTDDLAEYIAAVALDAKAGRVVRVSGETISPRSLGALIAEVRGTPVAIENAGTLEQLDRIIAGMRAGGGETDTFPVWQQLQYVRDMASGLGKLDPIDNARYPSVQPRRIRDVITPRKT